MWENATPATEFAPCHHLTQPCQCDLQKNTQKDTSKVLRLPRKMTMDTSKVLRLPWKLQHIFWKRHKSIVPATQNDFQHVAQHVWMSWSATPATRNEATRSLKPTRSTQSAKLTIGTAIRQSRERLRTVANVNATSSEHTLSPQTPRVKREPLLCTREESDRISNFRTIFSRNLAPVENGGLSHYSQGFKHPFGGAGFCNHPQYVLYKCTSPFWGFHNFLLGKSTINGNFQ